MRAAKPENWKDFRERCMQGCEPLKPTPPQGATHAQASCAAAGETALTHSEKNMIYTPNAAVERLAVGQSDSNSLLGKA